MCLSPEKEALPVACLAFACVWLLFSWDMQLRVVNVHASFLPLGKSCQGYYAWRTAEATVEARVGIGVLSNISCARGPFLPASCVCRRQAEGCGAFPLRVHQHSLFSTPSIGISRPSSKVTFVLSFSLLSVHPQHVCLWVREAVLHGGFFRRDCLGFIYLTSLSSYIISLSQFPCL